MTTVRRRAPEPVKTTVVRRRPKTYTPEQYAALEAERDEAIASLDRIRQVMGVIDNGKFAVAWVNCGVCLNNFKRCTCTAGPSVPEHIKRWMAKQPVEVAP